MPKVLLLLVHGMGASPPRWSDDVVRKLDEVAARYSAFAGGAPFSQRVTIEELRYDGVFERYVSDWGASAKELERFAKSAGVAIPRTLRLLTTGTLPDNQRNIFWSTLLDPLLYRAFPLVRDEVRASMMAQIAGRISALMRGGTIEVSVLAHSLGTAVVHDALELLGRAPFNGNEALTSARFQFENLFMCANLSRLGALDLDPYDSVVRPGSARRAAGKPRAYFARYYNFRHSADPLLWWRPFAPTGWGRDFHAPDPLLHLREANIHALRHYLDHPTVHIPIINRMIGFDAITTREQLDAIANYPPIVATECTDEIDRLKAALTALKDNLPPNPDNIDEIIAKGVEFYAAVKSAVDSCRALAGTLAGGGR